MKRIKKKNLLFGLCLLVAFVLWTLLVRFVDVQAIGPQDSVVGFATLNGFVHNLTGANMTLYTVTDWLGLVPFGFVAGFWLLGLYQWITRKKLTKVDSSILVLGSQQKESFLTRKIFPLRNFLYFFLYKSARCIIIGK